MQQKYTHCTYIYRRMNKKKNRDRSSRLGTGAGGIIFGTAPLVSGPGYHFGTASVVACHERPGPENGQSRY